MNAVPLLTVNVKSTDKGRGANGSFHPTPQRASDFTMAKVYAGVPRVLRDGLGCPRQTYREGIKEKDLGHFLDRRRHIRRSRRENKVVELIDRSSVHLE